jgi:lipid-binding SYLF domain-containing protein
MNTNIHRLATILLLVVAAGCSTGDMSSATSPNYSGKDATLDADVNAALSSLYARTPEAQQLAQHAKGILVFPSVARAGFIGGVEHGTGELIENGKVTGYYATSALSYGLQAGVQTFGYAMFFISDSALQNLKTSPGFEVGMGPSIVFVDKGAAKSLTTTTMQSDIYAFIFDQRGLMAGMGLKGAKITRLNR